MDEDWNAEQVLKNWLERQNRSTNNIPLIAQFRFEENETPSLAALEEALTNAALLVQRLGAKYIPLFERFEQEIEQAQKGLNTMERVNTIARQGTGTICVQQCSATQNTKSLVLEFSEL